MPCLDDETARGLLINQWGDDALLIGGVDADRASKPGLKEFGFHGIVCRDVFELELDL